MKLQWRVATRVNAISARKKDVSVTTLHRLQRSPVSLAILLIVLTLSHALQVRCTFAQTGAASLSGRVTDESNAVVPRVEVEIKNVDTNVEQVTKTNGDGIYSFPALAPGKYLMNVRKLSFRTVSVTGIALHTQDSLERNFVLQVGSSAESITVNANLEHMETTNPAVGLLVSRTFVENTPLNGRSLQDLIALAPGAVSSTAIGPGGTFNINGQRDDANNFTVDGIPANLGTPAANNGDLRGLAGVYPSQSALGTTQSLVSIDSLQEFKVQTSGYTAEYGRQPGGQVAFTTRSGTNDLHGSLFDYFRNEAFDANNWLANSRGFPREPERQNDFGGTVGGPLVLSRLYDGRDKTFIFLSYEGLRQQLPQFVTIPSVPSVALRAFAAPGVQTFLNSFPIPNGPGNGDQCALPLGLTFSCTAPWSKGFSTPSSLGTISVRLDHSLGSELSVFGRFVDAPSNADSYPFGYQFQRISNGTRGVTVGATAKLGSNVLDEFIFNYTSSEGKLATAPLAIGGAVPFPESSVVPADVLAKNMTIATFVNIFIPNAFGMAVPQYYQLNNKNNQYSAVNNLAWSRGRHSLKFGADYRRLGALFSNTQYVSGPSILSLASVQGGNADQQLTAAEAPAYPIIMNVSLYAQDHARLGSHLTLDYGLRWEFNPVPGASDGKFPLALTASNLATTEIAPTGTPQYKTRYNNFAPRIGFAYKLTQSNSHPMVVRGGYGVFYDTGQSLAAQGYTGYPFYAFNIYTNVPLPLQPAVLAPPSLNYPLVPPYFLAGSSDPNLRLPYTEQWNVSIGAGLTSHNTLTTSYVGNLGQRLLFTANDPNISAVNPLFSDLLFTNNGASSSYNALQIQDQGRILEHIDVVASYTWAHAIDNVSSDWFSNAPIRGNSDSDLRQVFNAAINYQPAAVGSNSVVQSLTGGWIASFRFTAETGYPIDISQGQYVLPTGATALIRPDIVAGAPIYLHNKTGVLGEWALNPAAFSPVPLNPDGSPVRQGDIGRNFVHGPNFWNLNVGIQRDFVLHEQLKLAFRVEAFNIFNHPNAGGIDNSLNSPTFGQSTSQTTIGVANQLYANGSPRSLQLMLRLMF
jgi:hypothetical protein